MELRISVAITSDHVYKPLSEEIIEVYGVLREELVRRGWSWAGAGQRVTKKLEEREEKKLWFLEE